MPAEIRVYPYFGSDHKWRFIARRFILDDDGNVLEPTNGYYHRLSFPYDEQQECIDAAKAYVEEQGNAQLMDVVKLGDNVND